MIRTALLALACAVPMIVHQAIAQPVPAPTSSLPRTANGHPDFDGVWTTRFPPFIFQRVVGATALTATDAQAHALMLAWFKEDQDNPVQDPGDALATIYALPKVRGEWRTSMLTSPADGKAPLSPEAEAISTELGAMFGASPDGPEMRDWSERCLVGAGSAPFGMFPTENIRRFVQTLDNLVIYSEDQGETRIIGIGAAPRPSAIVSFLGDSVALWEEDTLVVTTTAMRAERANRSLLPGLLVGGASIVTERFSYVTPDELLYQFTVADPTLYTEPWTAEYTLSRQHLTTYEHACHEGNYSLTNILRIARNRDGQDAAKR